MGEVSVDPQRVEIWVSMADHFLDTETRQDLPLTALACVRGGLSSASSVSSRRRSSEAKLFPRISAFGGPCSLPTALDLPRPVVKIGLMGIVLRHISAAAGEALRAGRIPTDVRVAADYPTEFSAGVGRHAGSNGALGPFFLHRSEDDVVVGEIGGGVIAPGIVEIGYAVVESCWGRGYATEAVRGLVDRARAVPNVERIVGHTPLDRPASERVLEKAGFAMVGEEEDEHEGTPIKVKRWELVLAANRLP